VAPDSLAERVLAGDLRALSRAASLLEYDRESGRELLSDLFARTGRAITIGITGPPGAGKSTLVNALTRTLRAGGKTVAVLAVDPSSAFSRGAILGDRIRMQEHYADPGVFIRSMATRGQLGGLASATLDLALLLDAAGWDIVLIETVGVGQDEIDIAGLADVTVVALVPGQGDDIQAIKAGVMEVADVFAINKADLPGVERLEQEIRFVQSLSDKNRSASPAPIRRVIATEGQGIDELLSAALAIFEKKGRAGDRTGIWTARIRERLRERLLSAAPDSAILEQSIRVARREIDPFAAVENLIRLVLKEKGEQS